LFKYTLFFRGNIPYNNNNNNNTNLDQKKNNNNTNNNVVQICQIQLNKNTFF